MSGIQKKNRLMEILYRAVRGEVLSAGRLSEEYEVSKKTILRDISVIKSFFCESTELTGKTELKYSAEKKGYYLEMENQLQNRELMAIIKILIGSRGLDKAALLEIINKLKQTSTIKDRTTMNKLIDKEIYRYKEMAHDCESVTDNIWKLTECIEERKEITLLYYKMNRELVERRIRPIAIIFSEYYFYLIAYRCGERENEKVFFRIDRIVEIVVHRKKFEMVNEENFDEGILRNQIQFMFPGENQRIRFEFTGPSVQAVLDRIPTARVVENRGATKVIEAFTYGSGIKMYLLSQGGWVKVTEPPELVTEMKEEIEKMCRHYK